MPKVQLITDSASDIPRHIAEERNIRILPFPIAVGDREIMDGVDVPPQEFHQLLLDTPEIPTHAQLTPFYLEEIFTQAFQEGYEEVIYVTINSRASATHGNAHLAAKAFYEEHPQAEGKFQIHILDSKCYTMGYGYAVMEGAKMAMEGATSGEICDFIQDWIDHVRIVFAPFDLKFAKKSGRISAAAAFMGEALGLKPMMTFQDGESKILSKVRGDRAVISSMVSMMEKSRTKNTPYLLIMGNNTAQAEALKTACETALGEAPTMEYYIGGVISINAGPNLVGLVYREDK